MGLLGGGQPRSTRTREMAGDVGHVRLVREMLAARAAENPGALAVSAADARLTYGELERHANQFAAALRAHGVRPKDHVVVCLERSATSVVAILAILKAGGVWVPLDPSQPADRLEFVVRDCGAELVVTSQAMACRFNTAEASVVVPAPFHAGGDACPDESAPVADGDSATPLAYVIYTSGSTGAPKGVLIEHSGLSNLIAWHQDFFAITASDRASHVASPAFDAAVWEVWPYLTRGASVHIPPEETRSDPIALRDWIVAEQITVSFLPTALAEMVMTLDWPRETALRYLLTGGDTLRHRPPSGLPFIVVNNYGPTEGTVVTTSGVVSPGQGTEQSPTIGRPISNVRAYVVDDHLDEVPVGTVGELLIGGAGVARGYLGQPGLTAEKFIPDHFSGVPGERLYRTGDFVRQRPMGTLEFHGRRDEQVQVRGNRVELNEVAAILNRHPGVRSAVATIQEQELGGPRLIGFVVGGESPPAPEVLRGFVAQHLPPYMVPDRVVYLDEMPLTVNGKIDRAGLPVACAIERTETPESMSPRNTLEQELETIVAELLGLGGVGIEENFFMLGGHSLLGAQLIARIDDRFGVEMSLRSLFDHPTVAEMAIEVEQLLVTELEAMSEADAVQLLTPESPASDLGSDSRPLSA